MTAWRGQGWFSLLGVYCAAAFLQLLPLPLPGVVRDATELYADEPGYWALAAGDVFDLVRPPGYPLFLRLMQTLFGGQPVAAMVAQSLAFAVVAPLMLVLLRRATGRRTAVFAVLAIASATTFTGLALTKHLMPDALFAPTVLAAFVLLNASRRVAGASAFCAGISAGAGLLLKPIGVYWFAVAPLCAWLRRTGTRQWAGVVAATCVVPACVWLAGCGLIFARHGVWTYSIIGGVNLVRYWVPATLALTREGRWNSESILRIQKTETPGFAPVDAAAVRHHETEVHRARAVLAENPVAAAAALAIGGWKNLPRPYHGHEASFLPKEARPPHAVGSVLTGSIWILAAGGALAGLRSPEQRGLTIGAGATFALFLAASSMTFWAGSRLLAPAEWVLFFFIGLLLDRLLPRARRACDAGTQPDDVNGEDCG